MRRVAFSLATALILANVVSAWQCTSTAGAGVAAGVPAWPPSVGVSLATCCELCGALPECAVADYNNATQTCRRFTSGRTKPINGTFTALFPQGQSTKPPRAATVLWSQSNPSSSVAWNSEWTQVDGYVVSQNPCVQFNATTGAPRKWTCPATVTYAYYARSVATVANKYLFANILAQFTKLLPLGTNWTMSLQDGSTLYGTPAIFESTDGNPAIGVTLMYLDPSNIYIVTGFNLDTGAVLWRQKQFPQSQDARVQLLRCGTFAVVWVSEPNTQLYLAIDPTTGVVLWSAESQSSFPGEHDLSIASAATGNSRYVAATLATGQVRYAWAWMPLVVDASVGSLLCTYNGSTFEYCLVIPDSMDEAGHFAVWCTYGDQYGSGFNPVEVRIIDAANSCAVVSRFTASELSTVQGDAEFRYDPTTRAFVGAADDGLLAAYDRDTGALLWAYDFGQIATWSAGAGVVTASSDNGVVALSLRQD